VLTVGSLFSGIGGFDLGFQQAGCKTIWFCERDKHCQKLLADKFPNVPIYNDINDLLDPKIKVPFVDVLVGGDPCPKHSRAKGGNESSHPDLSGHFLAVAGRLKPRWVVRENVPAPTVDHFTTALEVLGYATVVVWANANAATAQNREREFVVGCLSKEILTQAFSKCQKRSISQSPLPPAFPCLCTDKRGSIIRSYIWEPNNGLRYPSPEERELLGGFPIGWTKKFTTNTRARMVGNAVVPAVAKAIAVKIVKASKGIQNWPRLDTEAAISKMLKRHLVW
jgi:DNA (cytosine-5)-methyltransferase 1